ncbi:MAG: LacI family DNA-binding transcriptional regulator [Spirochaetales bacterium]|nr:LacI family DNA-binding transcriptional regulator [Spirochaetales bacterium]
MKVDSYLIAKVVGVSQATVSRAFSNPDKVAPATRQKIMEAAASMGYKPDRNASALRRKGTNTILLLHIKRGGGDYWTNVKRNYWIFSEALLSLTAFFEKQTWLFEIKQINSVFTLSEALIKEHCDGVIIFDYVTDEESAHIAGWDIPYVICHRSMQLETYNHSATDNRAGGRIQGEYLKDLCCRTPVYVMDEEDPFTHHLRREGFHSVYPDALVINSADPDIIKNEIMNLMDKGKIDSIAFVNDMHLVKTVTRLYRKSYFIQDLFPLIGYDNSTELLVLDRKPATIDIGIGGIYRDGAAELLKLIRGETDFISLVHQPELVPPPEA